MINHHFRTHFPEWRAPSPTTYARWFEEICRRTATLVRGKDNHGHWDPEPMPKMDLDPICMEFLRNSWARYRDPDVPQAAKLKAS